MNLFSGTASILVKDGSKGQMGINTMGDLILDGIDGSVPLQAFSGEGQVPKLFLLPIGNYTV
jgi:hypothetical protein